MRGCSNVHDDAWMFAHDDMRGYIRFDDAWMFVHDDAWMFAHDDAWMQFRFLASRSYFNI